MARTKQTAARSTGASASRRALITAVAAEISQDQASRAESSSYAKVRSDTQENLGLGAKKIRFTQRCCSRCADTYVEERNLCSVRHGITCHEWLCSSCMRICGFSSFICNAHGG